MLAIAAVSGLMYGCNSLLLSYLPISFGGANIVSTLVGMFGLFPPTWGGAVVGAAGVCAGEQNYPAVFGAWAAVLAAAWGMTLLFKLKRSGQSEKNKNEVKQCRRVRSAR